MPETTLEQLRQRAAAYAPTFNELRLTDPEEIWAAYVSEHSMDISLEDDVLYIEFGF